MSSDTQQDEVTIDLSAIPATVDLTQAYREISNVVSDDTLHKLEVIKAAFSAGSWGLGDVANEVYAAVLANRLPYTRKVVCLWVANYLDNDEHAPATIEDYAMVAGYYDDEWRQMYAVLPFSHFRYAMKFDDQCQQVLDESVRLLDLHGKPPSVKVLRGRFEGTGEPGQDREAYRHTHAVDAADSPQSSPLAVVGGSTPKSSDDLSKIAGAVRTLTGILVKFHGLTGKQRSLIGQIITSANALLNDMGLPITGGKR
jgi:hypothetical protein